MYVHFLEGALYEYVIAYSFLDLMWNLVAITAIIFGGL